MSKQCFIVHGNNTPLEVFDVETEKEAMLKHVEKHLGEKFSPNTKAIAGRILEKDLSDFNRSSSLRGAGFTGETKGHITVFLGTFGPSK